MSQENFHIKNEKGLKAVLYYAGFRKLWLAQILSQLADKFFIVLTVYLITQYWTGAIELDLQSQGQRVTLLATGVYISNSLPAILFGAFAGVASDIWSKVRVMTLSNSLRALLSILIPLSLLNGSSIYGVSWGYWFLLLITFFNSFLTQFFAPAEQSSIALLIPKENLLAANSLYQATTMGATIFGFALGDPLLRLMSMLLKIIGLNGGEFLLLPLCYLLASIFLSKISMKEESRGDVKKNIWLELADGINVLRTISSVRNAVFQLVILYSLMAALYVLTISLASSIPELGPTKFGMLLGFSGIGIASGAFIIAQKGHLISKRKLSSTGLILITFCLLLLGQFQGKLISTLIICSLLGLGASFVAIPAQTTVQERTPKKELGKVFGLQNNLINIALSFPLVIAGALVSQFGLIPVLWLLAALTLFSAISGHP